MKYLFILFILPLNVFAQNIIGLWTGTLYNDTTQKTLRYEIAISEHNGKYTGYSYTTFVLDNNEEVSGLKSIDVTRQFDHLYFEDEDLLYNNYPVTPPKGVKQRSSLLVPPLDSVVSLNGKFITTRTKQFGRQVTGSLKLERTKEYGKSELISRLQILGLAGKLSFIQPVKDTTPPIAAAKLKDHAVPPVVKKNLKPVQMAEKVEPSKQEVKVVEKPVPKPVDLLEKVAKRKVETIETVYFTSDSLLLALYDNGFVDGDSVSIIVNGKLLMEHQLLSTKAITRTIKTVAGVTDSVNIIMYAENLGSTAPNSGLLIIYDGENRHEITFSGDLQKNAAILLKRKK